MVTLDLENLEDPRRPSINLDQNLDLDKKVPVLTTNFLSYSIYVKFG